MTNDSHIGLTTASGIAYDQLAEKKRSFYDVEHFDEVLNQVGQALIRLAPVFTIEPDGREPRRLEEAELFEARVIRGASALVLADGRRFNDLSIQRADLAGAITILRSTGVKSFLSTPPEQKNSQGSESGSL